MVLLDVRLPGMSGIEALAEIRRIAADLPVLLITAFADLRQAVAAMKSGADDYLSKPIDLDELEAAIADALGPAEGGPRRADKTALGASARRGLREPGHVPRGRDGRGRGAVQRPRADPGRKRRGQGDRRPTDPPLEPSSRRAPSWPRTAPDCPKR